MKSNQESYLSHGITCLQKKKEIRRFTDSKKGQEKEVFAMLLLNTNIDLATKLMLADDAIVA